MKKKATRTKFNVDKNVQNRTYNGIIFDSVMEKNFYESWVLPKLDKKEIVKCEMQVKFILQPKFVYNGKTISAITYTADYVITYNNNLIEVIEIKGYPDSLALVKAKLFKYKYPDINYKWITYSKIDDPNGDGWVDFEIVKKGRRERKKKKSDKKER